MDQDDGTTDPLALPPPSREQIEVAMQALNTQMQQVYGPVPQVGPPEPAAADFTPYQRDAAAAARADIKRLQQASQHLITALDGVDIELLRPNLFTLSVTKAAAAQQTAEAITQANEYLSLALQEGPAAEQRSREYAAAVTNAWSDRAAAMTARCAAQATSFTINSAAAQARLEELAQQRRDLEQEQAAGPSPERAIEISNLLVRVEGQEQLLTVQIFTSAQITGSRERMRDLQSLDTALSEARSWFWRTTASRLLAIEYRRHQRAARSRWIYGACWPPAVLWSWP